MPVPVEVLSIDYHGTHAFPILSIVDRRPRRPIRKQWCIIRAMETLLWNVGHIRSAGQMASHLANCSMADAIRVCDKKAVESGTLTQDEYDAGAHAAIATRQ